MTQGHWWTNDDAIQEREMKIGQLQDLLADYRDAKTELQPAIDHLNKMARAIKDLALELDIDDGVEIDGASVKIRAAYGRVSWNRKGLEGYAVHDPNILQFRDVSEVAKAAVIKVK